MFSEDGYVYVFTKNPSNLRKNFKFTKYVSHVHIYVHVHKKNILGKLDIYYLKINIKLNDLQLLHIFVHQ